MSKTRSILRVGGVLLGEMNDENDCQFIVYWFVWIFERRFALNRQFSCLVGLAARYVSNFLHIWLLVGRLSCGLPTRFTDCIDFARGEKTPAARERKLAFPASVSTFDELQLSS